MKKMIIFCFLLPWFAMGQNNVVSAFRVFPKADKSAEFEKGMAAHAQKYHTGNWKWRVYSIESGPDYGGFHVIEGPLSWNDFDGRGNLGAEHTADWNKTVAPYITDQGKASYAEFQEDMSTVALTDFADKIVLDHMYPKPGKVMAATNMMKKFKAVWAAGSESVGVYQSAVSGAPQLTTVYRMKAGLKELSDGFRQPMKDRYETTYGAGSWDKLMAEYADCVESRWSEMLFYRKDLGSK